MNFISVMNFYWKLLKTLKNLNSYLKIILYTMYYEF